MHLLCEYIYIYIARAANRALKDRLLAMHLWPNCKITEHELYSYIWHLWPVQRGTLWRVACSDAHGYCVRPVVV